MDTADSMTQRKRQDEEGQNIPSNAWGPEQGLRFTDTYTINNCFVIGHSTVFLSEEKRGFRAVVSLTV